MDFVEDQLVGKKVCRRQGFVCEKRHWVNKHIQIRANPCSSAVMYVSMLPDLIIT